MCRKPSVTFLLLQLKESNIGDVAKTSEVEESAKVFLKELLSDVCGAIDRRKSEQEETAKESDTEGNSLGF